MFRPGWLLLVLTLLTVLVACGRGEEPETAVTTAAPTNSFRLSCSQECLARGQCGVAEDGRKLVLLVRNSPNVNSHDMAVAENIIVTAENKQNLVLVETSSNTQLATDFYQVFVPDRNERAWVVSWCVTSP